MPTNKNDRLPKLMCTRRGGTTCLPTFDVDGKLKNSMAHTKTTPKNGKSEGVIIKSKKVIKLVVIPIMPQPKKQQRNQLN